ncbi:hypothetical protein [Pseudactinotalea sp. Z1748]|uniref:hypothetical protein n=1 Tax=Pseudactinotalea sp. Z1748 TaxID=3413027 RepID=UPI003C7A8FEE
MSTTGSAADGGPVGSTSSDPAPAPRAPVAEMVLRWRTRVFAALALAGLIALMVGWSAGRDSWYLAGILLTALGVAGVAWVLLWRRPALMASAVAAVALLVLGLGLGGPWRDVAGAYGHSGALLHEVTWGEPADVDRRLLLHRDDHLMIVDPDGEMRPWWDGSVTEHTRTVATPGGGVLLHHAPGQRATVRTLDRTGAEVARWHYDLPEERSGTWWDGGVVATAPGIVVTQWCQDPEDCTWTGHDAETGEEEWSVSAEPVPNVGLAYLGMSAAGGITGVHRYWVATTNDDDATQLRDPATGSVAHTLAADRPVAVAGAAAAVATIEEECSIEVLRTDAPGEDEEDAEELIAPVECDVARALEDFPTQNSFLDGDLLWLPGAGRSHVIGLEGAQVHSFDHRVHTGRSDGTWTAGARVLTVVEGDRVRALHPLTGNSLWRATLEAGADAMGETDDEVDLGRPVVIAADGVVTVQVPVPGWLLEDSLTEKAEPSMVLHAFDAATGEPLTEPVRHRQDPAGVEIHDGHVLVNVTGEDGTNTYLFRAGSSDDA